MLGRIKRDAFLRYETLVSGCIISAETGDDEAYVVVRTKFGQSRIDTTITLRSEAKQLDFAAHVDWHEQEAFPQSGPVVCCCVHRAVRLPIWSD